MTGCSHMEGGMSGIAPTYGPLDSDDDNRHGGQTTFVFLDGHTETRNLADGQSRRGVPFSLFNPLHPNPRRGKTPRRGRFHEHVSPALASKLGRWRTLRELEITVFLLEAF